ncbi:uncharacterized protein CMU_019470 [Cryptosporidium muris RN66]|uniref:STL11/RBM22-like N-terminal domain-containing protein n=1 Tax=Cryptosporidium muris (strain RN66) TaxID=441375 RepID=B6ACD4_CRYMR|nr:uncharacterized protein CMU_019470 [Cryptosporidium muris RN66]EEA06190.1 hypothetical protein, conserved [Cryptosporidium muris RN66]|eukprot:XP_002140539.1 hypothetical protein [Cryptosporidium muris RN66]
MSIYEECDFPISCGNCLGDTQYLRMVRSNNEKSCKLCNRPCTSFRWKFNNSNKYKQTVICKTCAQLKNVCQVCVSDINYGIPLSLLDNYIAKHSKDNSLLSLTNIPNTIANRDYFVENKLNGNDEGYIRKLEKSIIQRRQILESNILKSELSKNIRKHESKVTDNKEEYIGKSSGLKHSLDYINSNLADYKNDKTGENVKIKKYRNSKTDTVEDSFKSIGFFPSMDPKSMGNAPIVYKK